MPQGRRERDSNFLLTILSLNLQLGLLEVPIGALFWSVWRYILATRRTPVQKKVPPESPEGAGH